MIKTMQALVDSVHKAHLESPKEQLKRASFNNGKVDIEIMALGQSGDITIYNWIDENKVYRCVFTGTPDEAKEFIANKEW